MTFAVDAPSNSNITQTYLWNGETDCAEILDVVRDSLTMHFFHKLRLEYICTCSHTT